MDDPAVRLSALRQRVTMFLPTAADTEPDTTVPNL